MEREKLIIKTEYDKQIEKLEKEEIETFNKYIKPLRDKKQKLEAKKKQNLIKTNTYGKFPLSQEYEGKWFSHIEFITEDGDTDYVVGEANQIVNGYPQITDFYSGNIVYNSKDKAFYHWYYGSEKKLNYIGYIEIEFDE